MKGLSADAEALVALVGVVDFLDRPGRNSSFLIPLFSSFNNKKSILFFFSSFFIVPTTINNNKKVMGFVRLAEAKQIGN